MSTLSRRSLRHPGTPPPERAVVEPVRLEPLHGTLRPGHTVLEEVSRLFREAGAAGGVLHLTGGRCRPYRYVIPAPSRNGVHAAWYSDTFGPPGGAAIREAVAIVGLEAGEPFLHCHGRWHAEEPGFPEAGHMLANESVVEVPIEVAGLAAHGAAFERLPDAETAFSLFAPTRRDGSVEPNGLLLRLRPGEDVTLAVERICAEAGIRRARIHGIGSVDGVRFAGGGRMDCAATEIFVRGGTLDPADGARIPVTVVDVEGCVETGVLERGDNPVGVTFEIVVEAREERDA